MSEGASVDWIRSKADSLSLAFLAAQDLQTDGTSAAQQQQQQQFGLRPGGKQASAAAAAAAAFLSRFTGGSSTETAVLQPDGAGGLQQPQGPGGSIGAAGSAQEQRREQMPVRTFEDWRPEPLLCKRFNVPDPYKGKPKEEQVWGTGCVA